MKRWVGVITVALFALGSAATASAANYKPEYKMSIVVGPTTAWGQGGQKFADLVKERTGGKINIKVYYSGQLYAGKQTNEFMLIKQGVADFALGSTINWSTTVKELNLFSLPFLIPDYRALDAIENGPVGRKIYEALDAKGALALGWGENGFREITNSRRAIKKPEDLEGLKIRVVGSPIFIDTFKALGANPVSMNWGEALTAFQSGTVDGQENPVTGIIIPYKLWTVHKYCTFWHYVIDPLILLASNETWKTFDKKDQEILRRAALEATAWQKAEARKGLLGSTSSIDELRKNGMDVTVLTADQIKPFKARTKAVYDKWAQEIGADLVKAAEQAVAGAAAPAKKPAPKKK
ncbi:MAG: 2,3-diketo-L-gulonate-binding periplasmic protein YiaO precursor [Syntrophaceae bacterium PtaB.Bin038]|nr:MAG: 2,3-diketo-L-gulonate-binding periplasmic protein YiaO precursor [Syntrophaceae bacterium PtaB.Bin038]